MAKKSRKRASARSAVPAARSENSEPKYPYTLTPGSLRRFLKLVPEKPKPAKLNGPLLKSWGIGDTNAITIIRVLKRLELVGPNNEPTGHYETFMHARTGPALLGKKMREVYSELFNASSAPHTEDDASLRRLFNIHAGGAEKTIQLQLQTFKALAEFATFEELPSKDGLMADGDKAAAGAGSVIRGGSPQIHIDLHIHLPPDRSSRDYEAMFEDIGKYLLGRDSVKKDV